MTPEQIEELKKEVIFRNLRPRLWEKLRNTRSTLSYDTVTRALSVTDYDKATVVLQGILNEAKAMVAADKVRIAATELQQEL